MNPEENTCAKIEESLLDYAYGELDEGARREVQRHLDGCSPCREAAAAIGLTRQAMRILPVEPPPQAGLESLLGYASQQAERCRRPTGRRWRWQWLLAVAPAGGLAAALVLSVAQRDPAEVVHPSAAQAIEVPAAAPVAAASVAEQPPQGRFAEIKAADTAPPDTTEQVREDERSQGEPPADKSGAGPKRAGASLPDSRNTATPASDRFERQAVGLAAPRETGVLRNGAVPGETEERIGIRSAGTATANQEGAQGDATGPIPRSEARPAADTDRAKVAALDDLDVAGTAPYQGVGGEKSDDSSWGVARKRETPAASAAEEVPEYEPNRPEPTAPESAPLQVAKPAAKAVPTGSDVASAKEKAAPPPAPAMIAEAGLPEAMALSSRGQHHQAAEILARLAAGRPERPDLASVLTLLAQEHALAGDSYSALVACEGFLARFPHHPSAPEVALDRVHLLERLKRPDEADRARAELILAYPGSAQAQAAAARAQHGPGSAAPAAPSRSYAPAKAMDSESEADSVR